MISLRPGSLRLVILALALGLLGSAAPASAGEVPTTAPVANGGDTRRVHFVLPFKEALAKAKREKRLLFVKPIYGGVNEEGAKDYRCGSW